MLLLWREGGAKADTQFAFGAHVIIPRSQHLNTGSTAATFATGGAQVAYAGPNASDPTDPTPVANLYLAHRLGGGDGAIGFGITSPFGLSAKFNSDWFGRYDSIEVGLKTINITAVGAYQVTPRLSLGGGIDVQYARSKLVQAIPNPLLAGGPTAASDARAESTASAWTPGFNIGFLFQPDEATRIGVHYRSRVQHKLSGTVVTSGLPAALAAGNGALSAKSDLSLPQIVNAGVSRRLNDKLTLYGEVDWYGWSSINELRVRFDNGSADAVRPTNYRNTFAYSLGADYAASNALMLRGGVQFDYTPTVDATRDTTFPDTNRFILGAGASLRLSKQTTLDFSASHVMFRTGTVAVTRAFFSGTAVASTASVNELVEARLNTLSAQLRYAF
jgi:long-chain fatty acid transport protein